MYLKEIAIIVAQGLLLLFFIYLIGLGISAPKIIETFENKDKERLTPSKLGGYFQDINDNIKDDMNLNKHRQSYQDALSQIHENVNLAMLQTMSKSKSTIPEDDDLDRMRKLQSYKDSVSELEVFLDGVKT